MTPNDIEAALQRKAEKFAYSQDDHYPNLPYKQMETEAFLAGAKDGLEIGKLLGRIEEQKSFADPAFVELEQELSLLLEEKQ